jgi:4-amino-4-deoxy-L-arabinose transferase-like glycosyltransferase
MERMGFVLEPRFIENASVMGYRIMGSEHLWIPRVLSSIFWVVGGFFLYLIAMKFFSPGISLFSTFLYLFQPYGILASRSIQPDPLMVMMMLLSIHRVLEYDETPSRINLFSAAIVTAIAVLIKPYCVFIIFGAFFSLSLVRLGLWNVIFHRNTLVFAFLIILPSLAHYGYNLLANVGFVGEHVQGSFLPHLLISPPFWTGWLKMIGHVVGYIIFILTVLSLFTVKQKRLKALLVGLCIGFLLFGISATYQIHTHNYYSMPFIPIAALSLGSIATMIMNHRTPLLSKRLIITISVVICSAILGVGIGLSKLPVKNILSDYKSGFITAAAFIGVATEFSQFLSDDFDKEVRIAEEIGEFVGHSTNTIFLDPFYGRVLAYYGEFAGLPWPTSESLYGRAIRGARGPNIEEDFRLKRIVLLYQGKFITYTPDYFIVTAFEEFNKQTSLKDFLNANFPLLTKSDEYLIYDLRKMSE